MTGNWQQIIVRFLQDHVGRARCSGLTLGLSGGLDSAVVAALACKAFGPDNVQALIMPSAGSDPRDEEDARLVAKHLGLTPRLLPIGDALKALPADLGDGANRGNVKARLRMICLYAEAHTAGHLVAGTGNKSELLIGYFTKHGDGGNDLQPIGDLYKTQVRELALELGLPARVVQKPPSAGLVPGQTDEDDLGMSYETLDAVLKGIELNQHAKAIAARTGHDLATVARVEAMVRRSEHKRHGPLVPKIGARTVGIDWRRSVHWDA